jgi:hypothetical protein
MIVPCIKAVSPSRLVRLCILALLAPSSPALFFPFRPSPSRRNHSALPASHLATTCEQAGLRLTKPRGRHGAGGRDQARLRRHADRGRAVAARRASRRARCHALHDPGAARRGTIREGGACGRDGGIPLPGGDRREAVELCCGRRTGRREGEGQERGLCGVHGGHRQGRAHAVAAPARRGERFLRFP